MITHISPQELAGKKLVSRSGERIGSVGQVYLGDQSGVPEWVTVRMGMFGNRECFVPLVDADLRDEDLVVPYDRDKVKDAPSIGADEHIDAEQEAAVYRHYGIAAPGFGPGGEEGRGRHAGRPKDETAAAAGTGTGQEFAGRESAGERPDEFAGRSGREPFAEESAADESLARERATGPTAEAPTEGRAAAERAEMTRSEEELRVGVERRETGRVRLHKYVVTEPVRQTVELSHEEIRVERVPVAESGKPAKGVELGEAEQDVVLHEERPIISKETVPKERVRVSKEVRVEEETVAENLRKERVEVERDEAARRPTTGTAGR